MYSPCEGPLVFRLGIRPKLVDDHPSFADPMGLYSSEKILKVYGASSLLSVMWTFIVRLRVDAGC